MMKLRDIHEFNPYSENELELLNKYSTNIHNEILKEINGLSYDGYKRKMELDILVKKYYYTKKDNEITNFIKVLIEKDTKIASIYPSINIYDKNLIPEISNDLLNDDIEEVFVFIKKDNQKLLDDLLNDNFISLRTDDDGGFIPLLKEKTYEDENKRSWKY